MARYRFAGGPADYVASNGRPRVGVVVTFWTAQTGGAQVTDLLAADGTTPVTSVTSGAEGAIPVFFGPDGVVELWALAGGARVRLEAWDTGDIGGSGAVDSVNGQVGVVVLTAASVGADPAGTAAGLDAALDTRLDTVEAALPGKADAATVSAALSGKADTSALAGYQPVDSDLTAIAALTTTSFGRSFLDRADAAAGRTLLGLGTAATTASTAYEAAGTVATHEADTTNVHGISNTATLVGSSDSTVLQVVKLTQAAYDALGTKVATTLYVIT